MQEGTPAPASDEAYAVGLGERRAVHVADEDGTVLSYECRGLLVQKVFSAISDFCVKGRDALLLARPLSQRQRRFMPTVAPLGLHHLPVACRGEVLQFQVDADRRAAFRAPSDWHLDGHIQIPAPARILTEVAGAQVVSRQSVTVPQGLWIQPAVEAHLAVPVLQRSGFERNPAQAATGAAAGANAA